MYVNAPCTGADPGSFLVARPGIYIRETNTIILFMVFKGNDLHSGRAPYAAKAMFDTWVKELEATLATQGLSIISRQMYVVYPSRAANQRDGSLMVTPRNIFGNGGPKPSLKDTAVLNYAQHGRHILGTPTLLNIS